MYWSEIGRRTSNRTSWADGSSRKILLSQGLGCPTSIVLDQLELEDILGLMTNFTALALPNLDGTGISVSVLLVIGLCEMSCALCKTHPGNSYHHRLDVAANTNQEPLLRGCVRG